MRDLILYNIECVHKHEKYNSTDAYQLQYDYMYHVYITTFTKARAFQYDFIERAAQKRD